MVAILLISEIHIFFFPEATGTVSRPSSCQLIQFFSNFEDTHTVLMRSVPSSSVIFPKILYHSEKLSMHQMLSMLVETLLQAVILFT